MTFRPVWCIRSSVVNKWVLYANPFLRFEQESGFLSFRKPSNNVVNYGYRTLDDEKQKKQESKQWDRIEASRKKIGLDETIVQLGLEGALA